MAGSSQGLSLAEAARVVGISFTQEVEPEDKEIVIGGMRFHYLDWGNHHKPPMLLLHGGRLNAHAWDFFALAMRDHFHIRALDQRGHGDSDWSPDGDYSRSAHQRDVKGFVEAMKLEDFVLIGHSMGGRNSIAYTGSNPNRVRALVIVDTGPESVRAGADRIRQFAAGPDELDSLDAFIERAVQFNSRRSPELMRGSLKHNLKQLPNGKWTWKYDKRLRELSMEGPSNVEPDLWESVRRIKCPTLIIRGGNSDVFSPAAAEKLSQAIPESRLVVVPNAGHSVAGDNPLDFEAAVRGFLKSAKML